MSSILAHIKTLPSNDRSREMVNFIGCNLKLARTLGQINFLIDCRSMKTMPQFILNKTAQINKNHPNQRITARVNMLQKTLLNEEIRDAFRKKAFLQRTMSRSAEIIGEKTAEWSWLYTQGRRLFISELTTVKQRLSNKLAALSRKSGCHHFDLTRSKTYKLGHAFGVGDNSRAEHRRSESPAERESLETPTSESLSLDQFNKASSVHQWSGFGQLLKGASQQLHRLWLYILSWISVNGTLRATSTPVEAANHNIMESEKPSVETHPESSEESRLVNLSAKRLSDSICSLLSKGPKYALTNRVTSRLLQSVEVGIERAFYGLKWKAAIEAKKTSRRDLNAPQQSNQVDNEERSTPDAPTMPRPYFPDTVASQPPVTPTDLERNLERVKAKILGVYRGVKKISLNSTATQRKELETLKKDENITIKRSDKCKSLVVMDTSDYKSKAEAIVTTYDSVNKNPTTKLEEETKNLMKTTLKGKIPDDYLQRLLPQHTRTAEFYGLPKTHKSGNPLRPIVSACGDPLDKLSWFLQCILTQLLSFIPAHLPNTDTYLMKLKESFPNGLPPGSIIFSLDVSNLYGSIPIREGIEAVLTLVKRNLDHINMFGMTLSDLRTLLSHVLTNNYVRFGSNIFKQTSGIAMGNRVAPPVAITFMHILETGFMATLNFTPALYLRYIDDILGVWTHGIDRLNHFFNCINTYNHSISFTIESTFHTGQLAFLDTLITLYPTGEYTTELYFKPMTAPIILHFTSAHAMSIKRAVLNAEVKRALRVSSDKEAKNRSVERIKSLFEQNGYPASLLNKAIKNNMHRRPPKKSSQSNRSKAAETYIRLPYVNEDVVRRVSGILRKSGTTLKVAWTSGPTLGQKLITSAFSKPPCPAGQRHCHACESGLKGSCTKRNVVYKITCMMCRTNGRSEFYIGESTRPVRYRYNEHLGDARLRKTDTPLGEHIIDCHFGASNSDINSGFSIEILSSGRDCAEIKITESIHIRNLRPTLNIMRSSWPLVH